MLAYGSHHKEALALARCPTGKALSISEEIVDGPRRTEEELAVVLYWGDVYRLAGRRGRDLDRSGATHQREPAGGEAAVEEGFARHFAGLIPEREPSTADILKKSSEFLSSRCGSEAVLSIGSGIDWLEHPEFAGVIPVMPHGCMPGGIVAAMAEKLGDSYHKPWISLTYDGFLESNNSSKITEFAELVRFCNTDSRRQ